MSATSPGTPARAPDLLAGYERIVGAVKDLSLARDLPAVMVVVRHAARELTGADGATFVLRDGDSCYYADEEAIGPLWKGQRFPMASCISGWAMTHRQPAVVESIFEDPRVPLSAYEPTFVRSVVMVPIRALDPIGAIGTYWAHPRLPEAHEVGLLQALADSTAVAMENVRVLADLEARVKERTAQLESFTFAVSHDLRAPIRHLLGYTSLLLEDSQTWLHEDGRKWVRRISAAASRMDDMVDRLLDLSRLVRAPLTRVPLDLAAMAREIAEECDVKEGRRVELVLPETLGATGDATLVRLVLQNLLSNAWKFTGKREDPRVELGAEPQPDGSTAYFVRDNGAGFGEASASRLFGVFQRLHPQEEFPGTGVGLATVQRIVQAHGGRVWASSRRGDGATFSFTLGPGA